MQIDGGGGGGRRLEAGGTGNTSSENEKERTCCREEKRKAQRGEVVVEMRNRGKSSGREGRRAEAAVAGGRTRARNEKARKRDIQAKVGKVLCLPR